MEKCQGNLFCFLPQKVLFNLKINGAEKKQSLFLKYTCYKYDHNKNRTVKQSSSDRIVKNNKINEELFSPLTSSQFLWF